MAYEFLKPYMRSNYKEPVEAGKHNVFHPLTAEVIKKAEGKMERHFPIQLKEFYECVGFGHLTTPHKAPKGYDFYNANLILHPNSAACFYRGQLVDDFEQYYMSEDTYEMLEPGDLPFFEMYDGSSFLYMKLKSVNPNAVWALGNIKIEDSFEKFIWRLYYEDPGYYGDIIEDYYKDK